MSNEKIRLAKKVSIDESDLRHYQKFIDHELFNKGGTKPTNWDLFIFFLSIGLAYDAKDKINRSWPNVTAGKGANSEYISLITAISHHYHGHDNFNKPSAIASEAQQYAKGGLHMVLKELEKRDNDSFIDFLAAFMVKRAKSIEKELQSKIVEEELDSENI